MKNESDSIGYGIFMLSSCHASYSIMTLIILRQKLVYNTIYTLLCSDCGDASRSVGMEYWAWTMAALSFVQFVYALPLYVYYSRRRGLYDLAAGIAIAMWFTIFLNGSCFLSLVGT